MSHTDRVDVVPTFRPVPEVNTISGGLACALQIVKAIAQAEGRETVLMRAERGDATLLWELENLKEEIDADHLYTIVLELCRHHYNKILIHLHVCDFPPEQRLEILCRIASYRGGELYKRFERHIAGFSQEQKYRLLCTLCERYPNRMARKLRCFEGLLQTQLVYAVCLLLDGAKEDVLPHLASIFGQLNPEGQSELILQLDTHFTRAGVDWPLHLIQQIDSATEQPEALLAICNERDPTATYELHPGPHVPTLFSLEQNISRFTRGEFGLLEEIVQSIATYTRDHPLPERLSTAILAAIRAHVDADTAVPWIALINRHPSPLTYDMVHHIHTQTRKYFSHLKSHFYIENNSTKLLPQAFDLASPEGVIPAIPPKDLLATLEAFREAPDALIAIPICFSSIGQGHYNLVYAEKTKGETLRIFIADSRGLNAHRGIDNPHDHALNTLYLLKNLPNKEVYISAPILQKSDAVCPIFTLDYAQYILSSDDIFAQLADLTELDYSDIPYFQVDTLPEPLLDLAQTTRFKTPSNEEHFRWVIYNGERKQQNLEAKWRLARLFETILTTQS